VSASVTPVKPPAAPGTDDFEVPDVARDDFRDRLWRIVRNPSGFGGGLVLLVLAAIGLAAPLLSQFLTHYQPDQQDLTSIFKGFSALHWAGTDELGRDELTRIIHGARISMGVAGLSVLMFVSVGSLLGIVAGYYGGLVDEVLMRIVDMVVSIPAIYLLILLASVLPLQIGSFRIEHGPVSLAAVIALISWARVARIVRASSLEINTRDFMIAAKALATSDGRAMTIHILPNVMPTVIVIASLSFGQVMLIEAALDFIGIGVQPPTPTWGAMLTNAQSYFFHSAALAVLPGAALFIAVTAANVFGNAVRDALDPNLL
jgi:peptide/nickel transport system permease protein